MKVSEVIAELSEELRSARRACVVAEAECSALHEALSKYIGAEEASSVSVKAREAARSKMKSD